MEDKPEAGGKPSRNGRWFGYLFTAVAAAAISVVIYGGVQFFYQKTSSSKGVLDNPASTEIAGPAVTAMKKTSDSFRSVVKVVGPAVVKIKATKSAKKQEDSRFRPRRDRDRDREGRDPFFDFFERFPFLPPQEQVPQESLGSGFIIDKKGYIITNNHVVAKADKIVVSVWDEKKGAPDRELKAKVIGNDPKTDLAVLKVEDSNDLPAVEWADSDAVEVGDWAIAIGSPFSLSHTVTVGIVSAKGRDSRVIGTDYSHLIQTDAAINPGNSGGPLCTIAGKVMGVNTAIFTRSGGYMGIGFAIPSNIAKDVANKLIADGKVIRGWLGVYIQDIDEDLAKKLKIKSGVFVHAVMEDSPAAKAGIEAGDVILKVGNTDITKLGQLQRIIADFKPGQKVKIGLTSELSKKKRTVTVTIAELPTDPQTQVTKLEDQKPDRLGLIVIAKGGKVIVEAVDPDPTSSPARQAGIKEGDVILRIGDRDVKTLADYNQAVKNAKGRVSVWVTRGRSKQYFRLSVPE